MLDAPLPRRRLLPGALYRIGEPGDAPRVARRLAEMGLLPGSRVWVVRTGLFGDPVEVAMDGGQSVALRAGEVRALHWEMLALPLVHVRKPGAYRVLRLAGGSGFRERATRLGLLPGTAIRVESIRPWVVRRAEGGEPVRLGKGEARKLIVERVGAAEEGGDA